jgi:hypothetical protein
VTDPVAHALLQRQLKKASPPKPIFLTLIHQQSGARKVVQYLGTTGEPLRAQIHWPIAGDYLVSPRSGTIVGSSSNAEKLRHWKASPADHAFLKQEYRRAHARVPQRPLRSEGLAKCR